MHYLTKTLSLHTCPECDRDWTSAEIRVDGYGEYLCPECECEVSLSGECDATFWSVALYETDRRYGGPEEGGWYYDTGSLIEMNKVRVFEDLAEAEAYLDKLWDEIPSEHKRGDTRVVAMGWTECLPARHWPQCRPHYC